MVRHFVAITSESFLLLRRDKIFLPALIGGFLVVVLANLASDWSIEDFSKILFDIGTFGFHLIGSIVALFWGTKSVVDSRKDGSLEVELAAPIGRSVWLGGKFAGLCLSLVFLGSLLIALWQAVMLVNNFGWMTKHQLVIFGFLSLGWIVCASIATFFATFCSTAVALFSSVCLWLVGLSTAGVKRVLAPEAPLVTRQVTKALARFWDLQQFNLSDFAAKTEFPSNQELLWRLGYGIALVLFLFTLSCVVFNERDVT